MRNTDAVQLHFTVTSPAELRTIETEHIAAYHPLFTKFEWKHHFIAVSHFGICGNKVAM